MAPICSWVEVETRRSFRPIRPIGPATNGTVTPATRVSTGSIQISAATSPISIAMSRRRTVEMRVSASLMKAKSVVKRWVSAAGLSRPSWARSESIRWL